jgi:hypothetical protein
MSCRSTPLSSAVNTLARKHSRGLTDEQCQHLFHALQREYKTMSAPPTMGEDQYRQVLAVTRQHALTDPLTPARRTRVLARLADAETSPLPSPRMIYAMVHLRERASSAMNSQREWESRVAARLGLSPRDAHLRFVDYQRHAPRSRSTVLDPHEAAYATANGLLTETATVQATARLEQDCRLADAARARTMPARVDRQPFTGAQTGIPAVTVTEAGWDPRVGRLEIVLQDTVTGETTMHAYRDVPAPVWAMMSADPAAGGTVWYAQVRANPAYAYPSQVAADLDAAAPHCPACGQYASTSHQCPVSGEPRRLHRWSTRQRWSRAEDPASDVTVVLPAVQEFRDQVAAGPVTVGDINETFTAMGRDGFPQPGSLSGDVLVYRDTDRLFINASALDCSCRDWNANRQCSHVDTFASAVLYRLDPPPGQGPRVRLSPADRARVLAEQQQIATVAYAADWTRYDATAQEAAATWRADAPVRYSEDFPAFYDDYLRAQQTTVIPFTAVNALDGICPRGGGQAFGVEIEYDFPETMSPADIADANATIGRALHDAGLTAQAAQDTWHGSHTRAFQDTHPGNWAFEKDGSVQGGELVSPGCYDEPDTWAAIALACRVLADNHAITSSRTGLHVHVGTASYRGDPRAYAELARLFTQHEDVLYRLSTNPHHGTHRPLQYCVPNHAVPAPGFLDVTRVNDWHDAVRYYGLNFNNVNGSALDHPEFRLFDASLDPGVIQAQIHLATGLTVAAERLTRAGIRTERGKEPLGAHARRGAARGQRRLTRTDVEEDSATTRSLLDTVFRRREDKAQLVAVYAHTRWLRERNTAPVGGRVQR